MRAMEGWSRGVVKRGGQHLREDAKRVLPPSTRNPEDNCSARSGVNETLAECEPIASTPDVPLGRQCRSVHKAP